MRSTCSRPASRRRHDILPSGHERLTWVHEPMVPHAGVRGGSRYLSDIRKHVPRRRCRIRSLPDRANSVLAKNGHGENVMSRWKILAATTALAAMVVATTVSLPVYARELPPLATATPEQVGMSLESLGSLT